MPVVLIGRHHTKMLEALESGDFSVIPDGPYIEGYYRAYCRAVGVTPIQRVSAPQMIPAENRKKPIMPLWVVRMVAVTSIFLLMLFGAYQLIGEEPLNPADTVQNDDIVENQQILKVLIRKTGRFRVLVDGELVEDNITAATALTMTGLTSDPRLPLAVGNQFQYFICHY